MLILDNVYKKREILTSVPEYSLIRGKRKNSGVGIILVGRDVELEQIEV